MFDIGFAELLIIGVVSLLVIGPERLPDAIRTASAWLNRLRRSFNDIKQEVQQELHNDSVMRELKELRESGEALRKETQSIGQGLTESLNDATGLENSAAASAEETTDPASAERTEQEAPARD
ncbi:MAG: Sec-independent protein translocase protein TatB [Pseudomonadota bacterium]